MSPHGLDGATLRTPALVISSFDDALLVGEPPGGPAVAVAVDARGRRTGP